MCRRRAIKINGEARGEAIHVLHVYPRSWRGGEANGKILTATSIRGVSAEYFIKNGGYESGGPCERLKINRRAAEFPGGSVRSEVDSIHLKSLSILQFNVCN